MFKLLLLTILGYFVFKTLRHFLLEISEKPKVQEDKKKQKDDDFQQKNQSKIEDADFEELD